MDDFDNGIRFEFPNNASNHEKMSIDISYYRRPGKNRPLEPSLGINKDLLNGISSTYLYLKIKSSMECEIVFDIDITNNSWHLISGNAFIKKSDPLKEITQFPFPMQINGKSFIGIASKKAKAIKFCGTIADATLTISVKYLNEVHQLLSAPLVATGHNFASRIHNNRLNNCYSSTLKLRSDLIDKLILEYFPATNNRDHIDSDSEMEIIPLKAKGQDLDCDAELSDSEVKRLESQIPQWLMDFTQLQSGQR